MLRKIKKRKEEKDLGFTSDDFFFFFLQISSNDGGGGERVLWCCVDALQKAYPEIDIVIFTGRENDTITANQILQKAKKR